MNLFMHHNVIRKLIEELDFNLTLKDSCFLQKEIIRKISDKQNKHEVNNLYGFIQQFYVNLFL